MHAYKLNTHPVRAGLLATIDDRYVLGVYPTRQDAEAAYDTWADMQEGRPVYSRYDDMELIAAPYRFPRTCAALDNAAQTGERVYIGTGYDGIVEGGTVLTCSEAAAYAEEMVSQVSSADDTLREDVLYDVLADCAEVDPRLLQMLRV